MSIYVLLGQNQLFCLSTSFSSSPLHRITFFISAIVIIVVLSLFYNLFGCHCSGVVMTLINMDLSVRAIDGL